MTVRDVPIGVACKDGSTATLTHSSIEGATTAALMAFRKKVVYGPAALTVTDTTVARCRETAVAQHGSRISVDGVLQATREVDVDRLYGTGGTVR